MYVGQTLLAREVKGVIRTGGKWSFERIMDREQGSVLPYARYKENRVAARVRMRRCGFLLLAGVLGDFEAVEGRKLMFEFAEP